MNGAKTREPEKQVTFQHPVEDTSVDFSGVRVKVKRLLTGDYKEGELILTRKALVFEVVEKGYVRLWRKTKMVNGFLTANEILHMQQTSNRLVLLTDPRNADWCLQLVPDEANTHNTIAGVAREIRKFWRYYIGSTLPCDERITMKFNLSNKQATPVKQKLMDLKKNPPQRAVEPESQVSREMRESLMQEKRELEDSDDGDEGVEEIGEGVSEGVSSEEDCEEMHMAVPEEEDQGVVHQSEQRSPSSANSPVQYIHVHHYHHGAREKRRGDKDSFRDTKETKDKESRGGGERRRRRVRKAPQKGASRQRDPFWTNFVASHEVLGKHWRSVEPEVEAFIEHKYSHSNLTRTETVRSAATAPAHATDGGSSSHLYTRLLDRSVEPRRHSSPARLTAVNLSRVGV